MQTSPDMKTFNYIVETDGFNQKSLEDLAICISNLQTKEGLLFGYKPKDVLQPWILKYFPKSINEITKTPS